MPSYKIMNENQKLNCILICDSTSQLDDINQIINKYNPTIIAFDNDTHNFLLDQSIVHQLSDDYLSDEDLDHIQDLSYKFSNWYNEPKISNIIEHDGINLGELFYLEFCYFLTPILKRIFEIQKISETFKNSFYISSISFIDILKLFSHNFETLPNKNIKNVSKTSDDLSVKLGPFTITQNSNSKLLKNIFKLSYNIFNNFFSSKKFDPKNPTILMVNFTTLRLQKFFEELPNHSINLIKYDTMSPAFWNFSTMSLIKKSGCHIENNETMLNNTIFSEKNTPLIDQKLNDILNHESFFKQYFSLNEYIFWNIIKNDFLDMFTRNYENAVQNMAKINSLFKKFPISYIILRTESDPLDLIILNLAKKLGIKTSILQHALYYDDLKNQNYYNFKSDKFQRVIPNYADNFLAWGKLTQIDSERQGLSKEKIIPIGCPFFDSFSDDANSFNDSKNLYILLASTPITLKNQTKELSIKTQIEYENTIKKICEITKKTNKKLLIKVHHGLPSNEKQIVEKIDSDIVVETTGSFYQYAKNCEVLICIDMTTGILEAMLLKKPVILVLINDKVSHPELFQNDYLIITTLPELENILERLSIDDSYRKSVIKHGDQFLDFYLNNIGSSSKSLLTFLDQINNTHN